MDDVTEWSTYNEHLKYDGSYYYYTIVQFNYKFQKTLFFIVHLSSADKFEGLWNAMQ